MSQTTNGSWYLHVDAYDNANNLAYTYYGPYRKDDISPMIDAWPVSRDWDITTIEVMLDYYDTGGSGFYYGRYAWSTSTSYPGSGWSSWLNGASLMTEQSTDELDYDLEEPEEQSTVNDSSDNLQQSADVNLDGNEEQLNIITNGNIIVQQSSNGIWYLHVEGYDNANNYTYTYYGPYRKHGDSIPPIISADPTSRGWSSADISVTLNFSDSGGSGFKEQRAAWSTGTVKPSIGWTSWSTSTNRTINQTADGNWYLHVEACDNANNYTYTYYGPYQKDTGAPPTPPISGLNAYNPISKRQEMDAFSYHADPVDTSSGAHVMSKSLLKVNGAQPIDFTVSYNSLLLEPGPLGKAWEHLFEARLEILPNDDVIVHWSANRKNRFNLGINGFYYTDERAIQYDNLVKLADNSFVLTRQDQTIYKFSASGRLSEITNRIQQPILLTYDANDRLVEISEPLTGKKIFISYNSSSLISTISDQLSRQVAFTYDTNNNLTQITEASGAVTIYTHNSAGQITTATVGGAQIFANTFDAFGRVVVQDDGVVGNALTYFAYDEETLPGQIITAVTDRNGAQKVFTHDSHYRLIRLQDELGHATAYSYDAQGNRTSETDARGNTTGYTYDSNGNLLTVTDPLGRVTAMTYDSRNNMLSLKKIVNGQTEQETYFDYDSDNRLVKITDALTRETVFAYDQNGLLLSKTLPSGAATVYTYSSGLLHQETDPTGKTLTYAYDSAGRVTSVTNAAGATSYTYDPTNRLTAVTDPLNNTITYAYDSRGNKTSETDARGNVTTYAYDGNDNLTSVTNVSLNYVTVYEYDGEGRLTRTTDARGNSTMFGYDARGQLTSVTNPLGHTSQTAYDAVGNVTAQIDALGKTIAQMQYDALNNLLSRQNALGHTTAYQYDALNRLMRTTDPLGRQTNFTHDALNRMVAATDHLGGTAGQGFNTDGYRVTLTDPNNNTLSFTYDPAGRLTAVTSQLGNVIAYEYNNRGLLSKSTNGRGQETTYAYDAAGRLLQLVEPEGATSYTYDANGNVLNVTNTLGTISYTYDALNRITSYTDIYGNQVGYTYNANSQITAITYPDGKIVSYAYNQAGQLTSVTDWANRVTTYAYNANGQLLTTTRPDGSVETRAYNDAWQLVSLNDLDSGGQAINAYTFTYDAAGNILSEANSSGSYIPPLGNYTAMAYSAENRLETYNGQAVLYDADSNMTYGPLGVGFANFQFDSRNRLTSAGATAYTYDPNNNRVALTENGATTRFVIDPNARLSRLLMETDDQGNPIAWYVYGMGLISRQDLTGEVRIYHYDVRGSTVALTDLSGTVTDRYYYGPYGELLEQEGDSQNRFLYNGRDGVQTDANGLYYMRARYYNPEIKRFINQDFLLGDITGSQSLNRFAYVNGNPVSYVDPFGLARDSIELKPRKQRAIGPISSSPEPIRSSLSRTVLKEQYGIKNASFYTQDIKVRLRYEEHLVDTEVLIDILTYGLEQLAYGALPMGEYGTFLTAATYGILTSFSIYCEEDLPKKVQIGWRLRLYIHDLKTGDKYYIY
jgi:RHS repeat-associated protein